MFANAEIDAICIDLDNTLWPIEVVIERAERITSLSLSLSLSLVRPGE